MYAAIKDITLLLKSFLTRENLFRILFNFQQFCIFSSKNWFFGKLKI